MPRASNRLLMVGTVSSAARIPLPLATSARAVSSRLCFITCISCSSWERSVPDLHCRRLPVMGEDAQRRGIEQEMLATFGRKADPPRDQNAKEVAVGEQRRVARGGANSRDHPIDPGADLHGALAPGATVAEQHPVRRPGLDLCRRESLV